MMPRPVTFGSQFYADDGTVLTVTGFWSMVSTREEWINYTGRDRHGSAMADFVGLCVGTAEIERRIAA